MRWRILATLVACLSPVGATPAHTQPTATPIEAPPNPGGNEAERWAWDRAKLGDVADLAENCRRQQRLEAPEILDPIGDDPRWRDECRRITAAFIRRVLTEEPWRGVLTRRGLWIKGARVAEPLDLSGVRFGHELQLEEVRFEGGVSLRGARFEGSVGLKNSLLRDRLNLEGTRIDGTLDVEASSFGPPEIGGNGSGRVLEAGGLTVTESFWLKRGRFRGRVRLVEASIGDQINAEGASFDGEADMNSLQVGLSAILTEAHFGQTVRLWNATVGRFLDLRGSDFQGEVDLSGMRIGSQLYMGNCAAFRGRVRLRATNIGGSLYADSAVFADKVDMGGLILGQSLFLGRFTSAGGRGDEGIDPQPCPGYAEPGSWETRRGAARSSWTMSPSRKAGLRAVSKCPVPVSAAI